MIRPPHYKFHLYVAGGAQNSLLAIANLKAICRNHLAGRYEIEITDVLREPTLALANGIYMTPTLIRISPTPTLRIVGTLSQTVRVLQALGLETVAA